MKLTSLLVSYAFIVTTSLAQVEITPSAAPVDNAFELRGRVDATEFIPANLMKGPLHSVAEQAGNDGLENTYFLYSGNDAWGVGTGIALRTRIREIYAIAKLKELSKTDQFKKAIGNAAMQKVKGAVGVVTNPFGTIAGLPGGASRFFGRIGEGMKGGKSESEDSLLQGMTGVTKAKMTLAIKYGVSPYSFNQELQKELTNNARAMAGGGLVVSGALAVVGGPAGTVITGLNVNQTLQQTLVNSTPNDLRIMNRKKLFAMGVTRENADAFLMHPWYSPWANTIVVDALASIGVDPTAFLDEACKALTEEDANYFQREAQVLARYHTNKAQLRAISIEKGAVCALDANGTLVVPLSCDYAIWSENAAGRIEELVALGKSRPEIKALALWVDGKVSERAAREAKSRNIGLFTGVLDRG